MKVVKKQKPQRSVTLRIDESVMEKVDKVADQYDISRQKLIESILKQVIYDKSFVLEVD